MQHARNKSPAAVPGACPGAPHPPGADAPAFAPLLATEDAPALACAERQAPPPLPYLSLPCLPAELFDPQRHLPEHARSHGGPSGTPAPLPLALAARANPGLQLIPRVEDCQRLWERYGMLDNIRAHSAKVADFAHALTLRAEELGLGVDPHAVLAAGLLHDLGKTYTIHHGGNHAQLGASWVQRETGNAAIARAVMMHVHWQWDEAPLYAALDALGGADDAGDAHLFMVMVIIYADKRTMHDVYVSLNERFVDLVNRYAVNDYIKARIGLSHEQGQRIEAALSRRLGVNLDECIADRGRLVKRT